MSEVKTVSKNKGIRIIQAPRQGSTKASKVRPVHSEPPFSYTANTNTVNFDSLRSISFFNAATSESRIHSPENVIQKPKVNRLLTPDIVKPSTPFTENTNNLKEIKESGDGSTNWYKRLTSKQKLLFKIAIVTVLLVIGAAAAVLPPVYVFVILRNSSQSSFANITVSGCSSSTCIGKETPYRSSIVTALYLFDGNLDDQSGYATGTSFGSPGFTAYAYSGQALLLNSGIQYVQIPNVNLAQQSFTLQAWLDPINLTNPIDYGIFGQCDSNSICLSLSLRNSRFALSFDAMNTNNSTLLGTSLINSNSWVHVTVVYDAVLLQQRIYVNGIIDAMSRGMVSPYRGASSASTITTIGRSLSSAYQASYFTQRIDHFTISAGTARTACQIFNDATLIAYYPFDSLATANDYSVYICNGLASGTTLIPTGRVGQAVSFMSNTSYFQSQCFPKMRGDDQSFSFSMWVNPTSLTGGGSLVHLSSLSSGNGTCYDALVLTTSGSLVVQWMLSSATTVVGAQGPVLPANTWTHVAAVYSETNAVRLFINGQISASSTNTVGLGLLDTGIPLYITLGNNSPSGSLPSSSCTSGTIPISSGPFPGAIDEFRLYNRELDMQEICVLANP